MTQNCINTKPLTEQAADMIEQMITKGELQPEKKLPNEYQLAENLGVGRGTIREAIKILESRHVVEIRRGDGTYVCLDVGQLKDPLGFRFGKNKKKTGVDLCEVRMMVEPQIAYLAAVNATQKDIEEMQGLCDEVAELIRSGKNYAKKDTDFHTKIASSTTNEIVPKLIPIIIRGIYTFVNLTNHHTSAERTCRTHQRIVDCIRRRDPEGAREAMMQHLRDNKEELLQALDSTDMPS